MKKTTIIVYGICATIGYALGLVGYAILKAIFIMSDASFYMRVTNNFDVEITELILLFVLIVVVIYLIERKGILNHIKLKME